MKKKLIVGWLAGLFTLFILSFPSVYSAEFPRHKNPAQMKEESFFPIQLVSFYAEIVRLEVEGKWDLASLKLKKSPLTYVPENLRYTFNRLNELIEATGDKLEKIRENIELSEILIKQKEFKKAEEKLKQSWMLLLKAERDLKNLRSSLDELRRQVGEGIVKRLSEKLSPLEELVKSYKNKIQNLYRKVKEKKLKITLLYIFVEDKKVKVGDSFKLWGSLKEGDGKALSGRKIDIFLEKQKILEVITNEKGEFKKVLKFPYLYQKKVELFAVFTPEGKDEKKFFPSLSNKILLEPIFYTPTFKITHDEPVYPVLPFKLRGKVLLKNAPLIDYPVIVKVGKMETITRTDKKGYFQSELSLPPDAEKTFSLNISVPPKNLVGPASLTLDVPVSQKLPSLEVNFPKLVVIPFPLEIEGKIYLKENFTKSFLLRIVGERVSVEESFINKNFKIKLNLPLLTFSGWENVTIFLYPKEPWVASVAKKERFLIINPLMFAPLFSLVFLFINVIYQREKEGNEKRKVEEKEKVSFKKQHKKEKKLEGLVKVYTEAVNFVKSFTGIPQLPEHTIREYMNLAREKLREKKDDFEFISLLTEKFLYSKRMIKNEEIDEAEKRLIRLIGQ